MGGGKKRAAIEKRRRRRRGPVGIGKRRIIGTKPIHIPTIGRTNVAGLVRKGKKERKGEKKERRKKRVADTDGTI